MKIRPAQPTDASAVNDLLDQLGYPQDDPAATAPRIRTWAADPASAAFVADDNGLVVGVIAVHLCPYFERDGSWGRIVALVVADQARGRGIGARLMTSAESFAATHGCVGMEVTSSNSRPEAHAFYRQRGYVDQTGRSSRFRRDFA